MIKIAIFYQIFDVNKNIRTLITNVNLCEIFEIEIIAIIKKLICNQFAENANDNVNDKINKRSKI